jgi:hypothetical protein
VRSTCMRRISCGFWREKFNANDAIAAKARKRFLWQKFFASFAPWRESFSLPVFLGFLLSCSAVPASVFCLQSIVCSL